MKVVERLMETAAWASESHQVCHAFRLKHTPGKWVCSSNT